MPENLYCSFKGDICAAIACIEDDQYDPLPCIREIAHVGRQIFGEIKAHNLLVKRGEASGNYDQTRARAATDRIIETYGLNPQITQGRVTQMVRFFGIPEFTFADSSTDQGE